MNLKDQILKVFSSIKEYWNKQTPKRKTVVKIGGISVVGIAVLITALLYMNSAQYKVLYAGLEDTETQQVYSALKAMEPPVEAQVNAAGEIMVKSEDYDKTLLALAEQNFPKSTLSYDIFLSNNTITSTESDKKQTRAYQLQDLIRQTLINGIDGVQKATVLLNVPEDSRYVWEQATPEAGSAAVTITMEQGYALSPERVSGIKNLTASAVPNMTAEKVSVIDGSTGVEMSGISADASLYNGDRLEYERKIAASLEDNARRILSPSYGSEKVAVVATVKLDYDKMITESFMQNPPDSTNPDGFLNHKDEQYTVNGQVPAGDIVGEENNTDTPPTYAENDPAANGGLTDYARNEDYTADYIKKQIEKVEPIVLYSSLAVTVDDENLTDQRKVDLANLVSKATNVDQNNVSIMQMKLNSDPIVDVGGQGDGQGNGIFGQIQWYIWLIPVIAIMILLVLFLLMKKRKKAKDTVAATESEQLINSLQSEIEDRKRQIAEAAKAESNPSDGAIVDEIRGFAKENPEITANLIRSWLKEDA